MNSDFEALISGVRHANNMKAGNLKPDKGDIVTGSGWFFALGVDLAEAMYFVSTADYPTELLRDENHYDEIADDINKKFGKNVVQCHRDFPVGSVGFIHPVTGENISFYG